MSCTNKTMNVAMRTWILTIALVVLGAFSVRPATAGSDTIAIHSTKILTMDAKNTVVNNGIVLIQDGKITAVGKAADVKVPEGARHIDAGDR